MAGTTTAVVQPGRVSARRRTNHGGGASRWTVLVVLCSSLLLVALDATVLHVAVPSLTEDLRPSSTALLWIVDAYPLVAASLLILFGTLGDRVGRRRVLLLGYALFGVASALAASAHNPEVLIAARALLGVGGAMIMPATLSILRHVFPERRERALAIGIWSATAAVGAAIGPLLGGFMVEHYWWGSVFLVNIPLMIIAVPIGRWLLPESTERGGGPWDVLGALMAAFGLFGIVYAVKQAGAGERLLHADVLAPAVLGGLLLALFVRRQRRRTHPLVDFRVIQRRAFGIAVGCIVLAMLALVGLQLIAVQYLQLVLGFTPLQAGVRLIPLTFAAIAAGLLGARMLQRFGPRVMVALGFVLTAVAVLGLIVMGQHDQPVVLTTGFVLLGFGLEMTLFGSYESMLSEAPAEQAGGAAAIGETSYQLGAGIGIALLGSVMNAVYRPGVMDVPGVPSAAGRAAGNSLGEAYEVAHEIGGPRGEALRHAAREAFVHGMHVTLVVSAGLLLLGALAALRLPRAMECGPRHEVADGQLSRLDAGDFRDVASAPQPLADAAPAPRRAAGRTPRRDRLPEDARDVQQHPAGKHTGSKHSAVQRPAAQRQEKPFAAVRSERSARD